jgi:hypothetical protein
MMASKSSIIPIARIANRFIGSSSSALRRSDLVDFH